MAKFIAKTHLSDINGDLVAPGTEIDESMLGDKTVIDRYRNLEAIDDLKESVIVTGEGDEAARKKAEAEATKKAAAEKAAAEKAAEKK